MAFFSQPNEHLIIQNFTFNSLNFAAKCCEIVFNRTKKIKFYFKNPNYDDHFRMGAQQKKPQNAEKFPLFLAVSLENRLFTVCIFHPDVTNLNFFFFTGTVHKHS